MIAQGAYLPPSQLRIDHDKYKNESIIYKNECDKLNGIVQHKDSEINSYKSQLSTYNLQLNSLNSKNNNFKFKEQSLNVEIQNKNNIINNQISKIELLEGSNIALLQTINVYKNDIDRFNGVVQNKDIEINNYKNQVLISNTQLSSVNSEINIVKSKEQQLNTELQNKNNIINNFTSKEQQFVSKIGLLEGNNILLLQQIDELQLDKKDLRIDKLKLNDEIEILKNIILNKDLLIKEQAKEIDKLKKDNLELSFKNELFIDETVKSILPGDIEKSFLNNDVEENKSYSFL